MFVSPWALVAIYLLVGIPIGVLLDVDPRLAPRARIWRSLLWVVFWWPLMVTWAVVVVMGLIALGIRRRF